MFDDLKRLVEELERALLERGGSLDAHALNELNARIESLKRAIDFATDAESKRLVAEGFSILAALLSIATNIASLLR